MEKEFGAKVISFAYPFGDFGQNSINFPEAKFAILDTIKSIYPMSFYEVWGDNLKTNYPQPNAEHLFIKRINVESEWKAENLLSVLENGAENQDNHYDLLTILQNSREKILPYFDDFIKNKGWKKTWGNMNLEGGSLVIGAHSSTTGSMILLEGTYLWQDYVFNADVYLTKGQVFSLVARYKDEMNYAMCSFSDKSVKLEQVIDGERKILSEIKGDFVFAGKNRVVGVGVYGNTTNCYIDGKIAMKGYNLEQSLSQGGIGFKTWDMQTNNSELIIKEISVEEIK